MKAKFLISKNKRYKHILNIKVSCLSKQQLWAKLVKKYTLWLKVDHKLSVLFHFSFVKGV